MDPNSSRIYFDTPLTQARAVSGKKGDSTKHYLQKIAKLVPIEIVGAYEAAILLVSGVKPESLHVWFYWSLFVLGLLGTFWYIGWRIGERWAQQRHLIVYGAAYVVWVYAISGDRLLGPPFYQDAIAGIALIVASVIFAKIPMPAREKK